MVAWSELLLPIALSAVFVFIASSLVHMVLKWHNPDYKKLPNEDEVRAAIRRGSPAPAQYVIPHCMEHKDAKNPEVIRKFEEGPIATVYVKKPGKIELGPFLMKWVVYTLVVGALCAYMATFTLPRVTAPMHVFRFISMAAWLAYAWQGPTESIWKGKPWSVTIKEMIDGLVYALITGGTFAWLWPH